MSRLRITTLAECGLLDCRATPSTNNMRAYIVQTSPIGQADCGTLALQLESEACACAESPRITEWKCLNCESFSRPKRVASACETAGKWAVPPVQQTMSTCWGLSPAVHRRYEAECRCRDFVTQVTLTP